MDEEVKSQIFIRLSDKTIPLEINYFNNVLFIKKIIRDIENIPLHKQRLIFGGKQLVDYNLLNQYGIQNGSTLNLCFHLLGGAKLGKAVKGRSKDKKKDKDGLNQSEQEKQLLDKIKRMELNDYQKRLAMTAKVQLQEKLRIEQTNSRINRLKIQNQWRKIMRLAKVESLRKDIDILSQTHERDMDRKDGFIQLLNRDLEESEDQFQVALRSHLLNVDRLIDLQDARLLGIEREFEKDLEILEEDFKTEKDKIIKQHQLEKNELLAIIHAVEADEKEREAEAHHEYEQIREEIRNKNLEDINVLRITLDGTIEELEQQFETAHLNYLQNTDQRTQDFKYLTIKDQELSKDIEIKIRKIERLQTSLSQWRLKIAQNVKECTERNKSLQNEKDSISAHFQDLKGKMNRFRDQQTKKLTELAQNARNTKKILEDHLLLAERILKLGELARKQESEQEKILPFYTSSLSEEAKEANEKQLIKEGNQIPFQSSSITSTSSETIFPFQPYALDANKGIVEEWNYLDNFWKRYNKVLLDQLVLQKEKEKLETENKELQFLLKQYLDGITVNDEVMANKNPLFVINGAISTSSNSNSSETRGRRKSVVEANHMVSTGRLIL